MTPNEYQEAASRTEYTPDFVRRDNAVVAGADRQLAQLLHGMIGMCTETGELQDMVKKHLIYGNPFDATNVLEECGDVLWYIALALKACGFSMEQCMARNIAKLHARFPDKFTEELANTRDLAAERAALEAPTGIPCVDMP